MLPHAGSVAALGERFAQRPVAVDLGQRRTADGTARHLVVLGLRTTCKAVLLVSSDASVQRACEQEQIPSLPHMCMA